MQLKGSLIPRIGYGSARVRVWGQGQGQGEGWWQGGCEVGSGGGVVLHAGGMPGVCWGVLERHPVSLILLVPGRRQVLDAQVLKAAT